MPLTAVAACSVQPLGRTTLLQNDAEEAAVSSTTSPRVCPVRTAAADVQGKKYVLRVNSIIVADPALEQLDVHCGLLTPDSAYVFEAKRGGGLKIVGQRSVAAPQLFKHKEFNFEKLGIGGLDDQFEQIFRRAFASRVFPPSVVERLGIRHVRGVLLYGPPGDACLFWHGLSAAAGAAGISSARARVFVCSSTASHVACLASAAVQLVTRLP